MNNVYAYHYSLFSTEFIHPSISSIKNELHITFKIFHRSPEYDQGECLSHQRDWQLAFERKQSEDVYLPL